MGNSCIKSDQEFSTPDALLREEDLLDSIAVPKPTLKKLSFLQKSEQHFNILQHVQLTYFLNALNNLKFDDGKVNKLLRFQNFFLCKDDWKKFAEYKILNYPTMPPKDDTRSLLIGYFDDVFDSLFTAYNYIYDATEEVIPKAVFVAYGFNHCVAKISQKINIFVNLFSNIDNVIEFNNNINLFLYCLLILAYDFPIVFLLKNALPSTIKEDFGIDSTAEFLFLEDKELRERCMRECFVNEINSIFGNDQSKTYKKEEFKAFLADASDKGGYWLLDNNMIRSKIEKYIK